jgi:hypothetical protein
VDEAVDKLAVALLPAVLAAAAAFSFTRHVFVPSLIAAFAIETPLA